MAELVQTISLSGFDPDGEPEIQVMSDGSLCLVFNFMPPSDMEDQEEAFFDQFDQELQTALGVPVVREDRERFLIQSPREDTVQRVTAFIKTCRRTSRAAGPQKKRGVRSAFHDAVTEALAPKGFRFRKKDEGYARTIPAGRQILYSLVDDYRPVYHLTFFLGIELDAVCAIVRQFGGSGKTITHLEYFGLETVGPWGAGFWVSVANAGATDEFLEPLRRKGFRIEPDELGEALRKATTLIHDKLLPFLDRYQDVASIDQALHGTAARDVRAKGWWRRIVGKYLKRKEEEAPDVWLSRKRSFDSTDHPSSAMTAIVIAHLAGNPRFEELARQYQDDLARYHEMRRQHQDDRARSQVPMTQTFAKLVEYLRGQRRPA